MIIFLYGPDTFRSRQKLNDIKKFFLIKVDPTGNSLTNVDGAKATMENISEAVGPASLLSRRRMIIVENLFLNKNQLIYDQFYKYLKKRPDNNDNIIVIWESIESGEKLIKVKSNLFKYLKQQKFAEEFKLLSNSQATAWAKKEIVRRGGQITYQAAMALTSLLGSDLWQISNEIDKLINYKLGQKLNLSDNAPIASIEIKDVNQLVKGQFDENIFVLTDAIINKNKLLAVRLFTEQIETGLADGYLLTMIIRQFRILLQVRQALDSGLTSRKIINLLKLHPFVLQKSIAQVRNFSLSFLKDMLSRLAVIDFKIKTGQADAKTLLTLLIINI
ncbi:DNA polymerase III subunit delta [Candidatus Falkowbacteria bacterium CG_4_9_14_3_um_filter_36_9]|uniref:DNA polymerase III subunit delta n=2 Tax=Candidatus Falkowiibacteriota TaxID=1752728 RepID=A0A1J4T7E8_9BACT|nr:MAG: DNA polymerase III subunit delta [Candidatus Falkowbacteria bacterium CG1_02_37_44]PIV52011.1 MAG: DNA polymerase III subunit delta [Candidatus Falkowbacteria bacterium CG02_land_8_20_14_3_00_36_14]PIX11328.1 MAG: DNA polymerase III subunit delta [Candidatus Falkowbacteria bacterium CG_4_8_14_3_um_filter_36_11]PJA10500.1 MAG: DNA polymerase III subunit delta [Candidatus Falkowbacteria bacterium CG_4_10_14_0_2_um_filter_36_22]PJB20341.1 MAG: DNA polymerase III subunit delta [Candidatus F